MAHGKGRVGIKALTTQGIVCLYDRCQLILHLNDIDGAWQGQGRHQSSKYPRYCMSCLYDRWQLILHLNDIDGAWQGQGFTGQEQGEDFF